MREVLMPKHYVWVLVGVRAAPSMQPMGALALRWVIVVCIMVVAQ